MDHDPEIAPVNAATHDDGSDTPRLLSGLRAYCRTSRWLRWDPSLAIAKALVAAFSENPGRPPVRPGGPT